MENIGDNLKGETSEGVTQREGLLVLWGDSFTTCPSLWHLLDFVSIMTHGRCCILSVN